MRGPSIEELSGDPHPHLAAMRARSPVAEVPAVGGFLVVGRAAALEVLHDAETFTVDDPRFSTAQVVGPSMLSLDGEVHRRHRTPFVDPFRKRHVIEQFGDAIAAEVDRRLDALCARRPRRAELRSELAGPVAASVMAITLGLDDGATRLLGWYRDIVASVAGVAEGRGVTAAGGAAMDALAAALGAQLRAGGATVLSAAAGELTPAEVTSNAAVVMFGGIETTEAMILNALWFVLGDGPPGDVAAAVEESLRLEPAAAVVDRYATTDTVLAGTSIPRRSLVVVSLAGANRDPAEFPDPDCFDPSRPNLRRQLAFAAGAHVCLGMDLARLEATITVAAVLDRLPHVRLVAGSPPPAGLVFRKPPRLDVEWDP